MNTIYSAKEMHLHGSKNIHLPDICLSSWLQDAAPPPNPGFHNISSQFPCPACPFLALHPSGQPPDSTAQSLCLHCSFSSLSGCKGQRRNKIDRCTSALTNYRSSSRKQPSQSPSGTISVAWAWSMQCQVCPAHEAVEAPTHHRDFRC